MTILRPGLAAAAALAALPAVAADPVWRLDGLAAPESVWLDRDRGVLYVSNIAGEPTEKNGAGHISRVSPAGEMIEAQWITGLDAPKGMVSDGATLWVSDIDRLVAIDIDSGEIAGSWSAEGAIFLNDTALGEDGRVYVSDMIAQRIHVLEGDTLSVLAEGDALQHPNGLNMDGGMLIVAPWGVGLKEDFTTETGGHLLSIDPATGAVATLGDGTPIGNLDGLEPDGDGNWIVSDWIAGGVHRIMPDGSHEMLIDLNMGSADLEYLPEEGLVIVPMMLDGTLDAYRLR